MRGLESIAESLFEKIRSRFPKITMGDENGAPTSDAKTARFFDFDYVVEGENHGAVSISIKEPESLKIYFSQDMLENVSEGIEDGWYNFLREMRFFAKKHMMGFDARDIAKSNLDKRDYKYLGNNTVQESAMFGTSMSSYENLDKTRLIIRHKAPINQEQTGARTRHISSLFIENESGERFKYPYAHLAGARAMARHVANGGVPHDDFGQHIIETSSNIAKLTSFKRYVGKKDFMNTTSNDIIEGANGELESLRNHIKKLQSQNYYVQAKENFTPVVGSDDELGEDVVNELTNAFTIPQFNEDLTDMFPLLHRIHQKRVNETTLDLDDVVSESDMYTYDDLVDIWHKQGEEALANAIGMSPEDFDNEINNYAADGMHPDDDREDIIVRIIDDALEDADDPHYPGGESYDFESWAESVIDEGLDKGRIKQLNKLIGQHFSVGPDATNALNSLKGIISDPELENELKDLADNDSDACARPTIYRYIKKTQPAVLDKLDFGDMTMEDDTTDVVIGKDGAMKLAGQDDDGVEDKKASTEEIVEFVRSFYDKETGAFPKGETGVVISARKKFGDEVGDLVERFVKKLTGKEVNIDAEVEEGKDMCPCCDAPVSECTCAPDCPNCDCNADKSVDEDKSKDKDNEKDNEGFSDKQIRMAYGILNDPRYKGGNLTGAADAIEKIAKGLTKHKGVANAMRATSESAELERIKKLSGL